MDGTLFVPVRREATRDKVCAAIREAIFSGRLSIGQRLPEAQLTRDFQVSRGVVREAIQQLAYEGLVEQTINCGAKVVDLSAEQVGEILHVRAVLESETVRLARGRMRPEDAVRLRELAREVETSRQDVQTFVRRDFAFHEAIWTLSGNQTLVRQLVLLTAPVFSMGTIARHSRLLGRGPVPVAGSDHRRLARAITDGNDAEAEAAIREHIAHNWNRTRSAIEQLHQPVAARGSRARRQRARTQNQGRAS
jgi:DNA-binding GntR family transcriptional regulator